MQREFEPVGPIMFKNPLGVGWGLLPTLQRVGCCLPTYLASFFYQVEIRFLNMNQTPAHNQSVYDY